MTSVKVFTAGGWRELGYVAPSSVAIEAWHNFGAAGEPAMLATSVGAPHPTPGYRKRPDGVVELRGYLLPSNGASPLLTLPAGYRPSGVEVFPITYWSGTATVAGRVQVNTDGTVVPYGTSDTVGSLAYLSLAGIEFPTDQATFPTGPAAPEAFAPRVTSLPVSPVDGQEVVYVADAANGVLWRLRYNAGAVSVYKWEFVGGPAMSLEVEGVGGYNSATPVDPSGTVGPGRTPPLAGEYEFAWGANFYAATATNVQAHVVRMSDALSMIALNATIPASNAAYTFARQARLTVVTAGVEYRMRYVGTATTTNVRERWLRVTPVRVG